MTAAVRAPAGEVARLLAPFPCRVEERPDGWVAITEGPVLLYTEMLTMHGTIRGPQDIVITTGTCTCKTKHALIPAHSIARWATSLEGTPLAQALCPGARFLGAYLCGRCRGYEQLTGITSLSGDALAVCQAMSWKTALDTGTSRAGVIHRAGGSLANRVEGWSTHIVSTIPYPAAVVGPGPVQLGVMHDLMTTLFSHGEVGQGEPPRADRHGARHPGRAP